MFASPGGAAIAVVGVGVAADVALALSGHDTLSIHAGRHPRLTLCALVALWAHFNAGRIFRRAARKEGP